MPPLIDLTVEPFEFEGVAADYSESEATAAAGKVFRGLKVAFRPRYADFRREVHRAIGRWAIFRSDQGRHADQLIAKHEDNLKEQHRSMLKTKLPDGTPVVLNTDFEYRGQPGHKRVVDVSICCWYEATAKPTGPSQPAQTVLYDLLYAEEQNRLWGKKLGWWDLKTGLALALAIDLGLRPVTNESQLAWAVFLWQQQQGLKPDGIIGPKTWQRMREALPGLSQARLRR